MAAHLRTNAIVSDMANGLALSHLQATVELVCRGFGPAELQQATILSDEAPDMHVARLCAGLSPDRLNAAIAFMSAQLTPADLTQVLLNAIPTRKLRWFQPPKPEGRAGLKQPPRQPLPVHGLFYDPEVSQQFGDTEALEYLELIHGVVLARDPERDAETLAFLLGEFAAESAKQEGIPTYFHPILIIFEQWHKLTHAFSASAVGAKVGVESIKGGLGAAMSAAVDSSGAALACMRAALEQVDLGAHGGLETLGARLRVPKPDPVTRLYKGAQFKPRHVRTAYDGLGKNVFTKEDDNFKEYVQAYMRYQDQDNTVARMARRRAGHAARHSEHAKRARVLEAVDVEAEDLAPPRAAPRRRSAVSGAGEAGRSRAGGGAYAREPFDCDVREDEAGERARRRRREMEERHAREREVERQRTERERRAMAELRLTPWLEKEDAWNQDMDGWYNG